MLVVIGPSPETRCHGTAANPVPCSRRKALSSPLLHQENINADAAFASSLPSQLGGGDATASTRRASGEWITMSDPLERDSLGSGVALVVKVAVAELVFPRKLVSDSFTENVVPLWPRKISSGVKSVVARGSARVDVSRCA